jgi:TIR domain
MPGFSSRKIFLSYRRADAAPHAVMLQSRLREHIPDAGVFMDLVDIEPGLEFVEVIREAIDSCAVLVALIGLKWVTLADEEGCRRIDDPDDYVRFEIQAALERDVRVIPVLVDGARPLQQQQLPAELQKLARLQALELSYGRYDYDADQLLNLIQRVLPPPPDPPPKDPVRAVRLVADAERIADSITDERAKAEVLCDIAGVLAATDPDRAERIAQSITDKNTKEGDSPVSRGCWQPPTRTARNTSPSRSPTSTRRQRRSPTSRGCWKPRAAGIRTSSRRSPTRS